MPNNRLGGERFDRLYQHGLEWYAQNRDDMMAKVMADGFPPGTVPLTPQEQIQRLTQWKAAMDPRYWGDPAAQDALDGLLARYGPQANSYPYPVPQFPAPPYPPPQQNPTPNQPPGQF